MACCDACAKGEATAARARFAALRRASFREVSEADLELARKVANARSNEERGEVAGAAGGGAAGAYAGPGGAVVGAYVGKKLGGKIGGWFDRPDCKPGEDPNDPECDGVQVISGVRICSPGESPSTGCIPPTPEADGGTRRSAPATGAFPTSGGLTYEQREEAERTRQASATYDAERDAGMTDKERDEKAAALANAKTSTSDGVIVGAVVVGVVMVGAAVTLAYRATKKRKRART